MEGGEGEGGREGKGREGGRLEHTQSQQMKTQ